jgi:hypothetical protein
MTESLLDFNPAVLHKGDSLLYYGNTPPEQPNHHADFVDWAIAVKTGYFLAHVEIYWGQGMSVASRNGIGVNRYPLRTGGIVCVRRPQGYMDFDAADFWFNNSARGQKYDFKGLLCFYLAVKQGSMKKMFCSEFELRYYRKAGFNPVHTEVDADRTPPSMSWISQAFETVWIKRGFEP